MKRFNRARLITFDDPAYQQHVAQHMVQRANNRAIRPPSQRDLFGGQVEDVLRSALAARWTLSDRRILEYEEQIGRTWQRKYRELDALVIDGHTHAHVFEIKASRRAGAIHRALRQLSDTRSILSLAVRHVGVSVLLVDTGIITATEQAALVAELDAPERVPQTLDEALAEHADVQRITTFDQISLFAPNVQVLVLSVADVVALAGDRSLSLDWDADEAEAAPEPQIKPETLFYSTPDDDDDNPLAAALRQAMKKRDT